MLLLFAWAGISFAEETVTRNHPTETILIARTGEQFQAPHVFTFHLLEIAQQRGRWLEPDFGVYDCGHGDYRELFIGGGPVYYQGKHVMLTQELFFAQDTGAAAHSARYFWIWPVANFQFTRKLSGEAVFVPCLPLNHSARLQYDFDRAKLEYAMNRVVTAGAGYSAYKYDGEAWQNKPFLTSTVSTRMGSFEFWLQKIPGGGQLQLRYQLVHEGRK